MTNVQQTCVTCGTPEHRRKDAKGQELTNLSPITGQCVDCLIATSKKPRVIDEPFDGRAAAAGPDAD